MTPNNKSSVVPARLHDMSTDAPTGQPIHKNKLTKNIFLLKKENLPTKRPFPFSKNPRHRTSLPLKHLNSNNSIKTHVYLDTSAHKRSTPLDHGKKNNI